MKFKVEVSGEDALGLAEQDYEVEAASGTAAVDSARKKLNTLVTPRGGSLDVKVVATEAWEQVSRRKEAGGYREIRETIPAGLVSEFSVRYEPHESVRAEVEAELAQKELEASRAKMREEIRLEVIAEMKAKGELEVKS